MKITDPELIKTNEKHLFDIIIENLDWKVVESLVHEKFDLQDLQCKKGDFIVHKGEIAYKLNLEVKLDMDILFDREGRYLASENGISENMPDNANEPVTEMDLSDIEDLISEDSGEEELSLDVDITSSSGTLDLQDVLKKNRNFWEEKSQSNSPDSSVKDNFQEALKRNRDFWTQSEKK